MRKVFWLIVTVALVACDRKPAATTAGDTAGAAVDISALPPLANDDTLRFERSRAFDFDGDGASEIIHVLATGARWDSMRVDLTIRSSKDSLLYADSFTTVRYGGLEGPDPQFTRAQVDSVMQDQLNRLLSDDAFLPTAEHFDEDNIDLRYTYEREVYYRRYADDRPGPGDSTVRERRDSLNISEAEYLRFEQEIMSRPMFKYYIGGESSTGITWSTILGKFIETWLCC